MSPSGDEARYICGATLISADALLTAAHCVWSGRGGSLRTSALRVVLSATSSTLDLQVGSRRAHVQTNVLVPIKSIVVHEDYNPGSYEADIVLIRLLVPAPISDYVYPVCFPLYGCEHEVRERIQLSAGSVGSAVGFGVDETGAVSPTLKRATLPVVSARECKRVLGFVPSTNQICAGHTTGIAVCNGDSGAGPSSSKTGPEACTTCRASSAMVRWIRTIGRFATQRSTQFLRVWVRSRVGSRTRSLPISCT